MNPGCSPSWVIISSALLTPLIGVLVAYVAFQQWRTARNRLKLDLFDRRLAVYQQARDFLVKQMALGHLESTEIAEFAIKTRVSRWLFNPSLADYLEREVAKAAMDVSDLESQLEAITSQPDRAKSISQQGELRKWLNEQLYTEIDRKFAAFLQLAH